MGGAVGRAEPGGGGLQGGLGGALGGGGGRPGGTGLLESVLIKTYMKLCTSKLNGPILV